MKFSLSSASRFHGDCLSAYDDRLLNIEARLSTPLVLHSTESPSTSDHMPAFRTSDQLTLDKYLSLKSSPKSAGIRPSVQFQSETFKSGFNDLLRSSSSPDRKKRPRNLENFSIIPSNENLSSTKKRLVSSAAFSGPVPELEISSFSCPLDQSNSNSMEIKSDYQGLEILTEMVQNESSSAFFKNSLTCSLSQKVAQLKKQVSLLEEELCDSRVNSQNNEKRIVSLVKEKEAVEEENVLLKKQVQVLDSKCNKGKNALVKALKELEEKKRLELKTKLFNDSFRLGRVTVLRNGTRFQEYWEDGKEITSTKEALMSILKQREALEKMKKSIKKGQDEDFFATLPLKLSILTREEVEFKEKLEKLDVDKNLHIQVSRLTAEEEAAKYAKSTAEHQAWPILHNRYLLLSLLGKGGYSEVYKAYDLEEHLELAVKFHSLNPSWPEVLKVNYIKHALRENQIHREVNHPRIVKHFDTVEIDNNCFCTILEYCPGEDLHNFLKKHKSLSEKEAKSIIQQLFAGLKYLNDQAEKIIHFDLKPHNILLNNGEIKITDFGLSKIMDSQDTKMELTSQGVGTYWYQAPECFETGTAPPKISSKVDVWSAGVILYEMIYGQKPFGHNMPQEKVLSEQIIINATSVTFPAKPAISNECKEFIKKCLEYKQEDRWDVNDACNSAFVTSKR